MGPMRLLVVAMVALAASASAAGEPKEKVLVLLDNLGMQESHSKFLQNFGPKDYEVKVASVDAKSIKLREWDDWLFDKLVILGGTTKLGDGVRPSVIAEFFAAGRDVVLALGSAPPSQLRDLALALGVDVAPTGQVVIDHFSHDAKLADDHTAVLSSALTPLPAVFSPGTKGPVAFQGVGLSVSAESETAFLALVASDTAYSGPAGKPPPSTRVPLAGGNLGLVALVQGRNNARAGVFGSTAALSNAFFAAAGGNAPLAADVARWATRRRGVLHASPLRHALVGGPPSPPIYRIKDQVTVAVDIEECGDGGCRPFKAGDVAVEFVMLDPYVRAPLVHQSNGTFAATVTVPDVYGVFKWVLDYRRPGLSWVRQEVTVPVRPYRHYEYERFIVQAYPYYAAAASMGAGFFALGFFFLYTK